MKKALIVSYNFPPVGGAGVQRPVKFVKHLREFGWEPVVLSVANPSVPVTDASLLADIPPGVKVYRARTLEPSYAAKNRFAGAGENRLATVKGIVKRGISRLLLPDLQVLWWPGFVYAYVEILLRERPDVVFVSAPPFSSFIPAVALGRFFGRPVVLDYRDEWLFTRENWENSTKNALARRLDRFLERYALTRCTAFVTANKSYVDAICARYDGVPPEKGTVITNGYDEDDLGDPAPLPASGETVTIAYAGTVWRATSLAGFVRGLERFCAAGPGEKIAVRIYGRVVAGEMEHFDRYAGSAPIEMRGYLDHGELLRETAAADILLLTLSDLPGAERIVTGKVFEYMATGKHILAILPEGETRAILREHYDNVTFASADPADICAALGRIVGSIGAIRTRRGKEIPHFTRRRLTGKLSNLFDAVAGGSTADSRHSPFSTGRKKP